MTNLPSGAVKQEIIKTLTGLKEMALHTFAGPEDPFIETLNQAFMEIQKIPQDFTGESYAS